MSEPTKEIIRINQCANDCKKLLEGAGAEIIIIMATDRNHSAVIAPKDPPAVLSLVYQLLESLTEEDPMRHTVTDYLQMLHNAAMMMEIMPASIKKSRWTDFTEFKKDDNSAAKDFLDALRDKLDGLGDEDNV